MPEASSSDALADRKGAPLRLVGGSLKSHSSYINAWIDEGLYHTKNYYNIIIEKPDEDDPRFSYLEARRVRKENCKVPHSTPASCAQAAFQQAPQLEERLRSFARMAAMCRLSMTNNAEFFEIVKSFLDEETTRLSNMGSRANYKYIDESVIVVPVAPRSRNEPN